MEQKMPLQFPCSFPIKVMGRNGAAFTETIADIFQRHAGGGEISTVGRLSKGGKYLSLTVTLTATSREQLDALYRELNAHELVLMTF
jgi:putative lipoic acid-binding regulatory protein